MSEFVYREELVQVSLLNKDYLVAVLPVSVFSNNNVSEEITDVDTDLIKTADILEAIQTGTQKVIEDGSTLKNGQERFHEEELDNLRVSYIYGVEEGKPYLSLSIEFVVVNSIELITATFDEEGTKVTSELEVFEEVFGEALKEAIVLFQKECGIID